MPSNLPHTPVGASRANHRPAALWRNTAFLLLWSGDAISALGSQASQLALPLLALALTGSPAQAGYLGALRGAIYLLGGLPTGALVDRWHRRVVLVVADLLRAAAFASVALALALGRLAAAQLYAVVALDGLCFIAFGLAQSQAADALARALGPLLGGALFAASRALPFLADAASYALSAALILVIRTPLAAAPSGERPRSGARSSAGWRGCAGSAPCWPSPSSTARSTCSTAGCPC